MGRTFGAGRHAGLATCALVAVLGLGGGCSTQARYEVLTFFFTGVPPPGEQQAAPQGAGKPAGAAPAARRARREFFREPVFFVHGPYGAGRCDKCHAVTASKPFRTAAGKAIEPAGIGPARTNIGPRLAAPLKELCLSCHSEKAYAVAEAQGLWMHGPVANGWCVACHNPHRAARKYMLLGKSNVDLCTGCHRAPELLRTAAHRKEPEADCLTCHNPHQGKSTFLLRVEHDEWRAYGKGG